MRLTNTPRLNGLQIAFAQAATHGPMTPMNGIS
jgi:hypothetical protein